MNEIIEGLEAISDKIHEIMPKVDEDMKLDIEFAGQLQEIQQIVDAKIEELQ